VADAPIVAKVFRFWPGQDEEPHYQTYRVPYKKGLTVLGLLRFVYRNLDPTLAFRDFQCGVGICATCRMRIDGASRKACIALLEPGTTITIEPVHKGKVIRDLASTLE
jgi:succinate dehydrogenase/fumarate reductase-like Fe-S protein